MIVRLTQQPVVEMTMTKLEALGLRHMLDQWVRSAKRGEYGGGTSVDDDIRMAEGMVDSLDRVLKT